MLAQAQHRQRQLRRRDVRSSRRGRLDSDRRFADAAHAHLHLAQPRPRLNHRQRPRAFGLIHPHGRRQRVGERPEHRAANVLPELRVNIHGRHAERVGKRPHRILSIGQRRQVPVDRRPAVRLLHQEVVRERPRFGVEHGPPIALVVEGRRLIDGQQLSDRNEPLLQRRDVTLDRPADLRLTAVAGEMERAVVLGEPFVEPRRRPARGAAQEQVRVLVEDDPRRLTVAVQAHRDEVALRSGSAVAVATERRRTALVERHERLERLRGVEGVDQCRHPRRQPRAAHEIADRDAELPDLHGDRPQRLRRLLTDDGDVAAADEAPGAIGRAARHRKQRRESGSQTRALHLALSASSVVSAGLAGIAPGMGCYFAARTCASRLNRSRREPADSVMCSFGTGGVILRVSACSPPEIIGPVA